MRIQYRFRDVIRAALLLSCFAAGAIARQSSQQQDLPRVSPAVHAALYPEVMCVHCIAPQWDRGYILHLEIDRDPAVVTMYDRDAKKVLEARTAPPDAAQVSLLAAAATHAGGILAVGGGIMTDGSIEKFIAKTDLTGRTIQSVHTDRFSPRQVCEVTDGTVWTLGYALDYRDSPTRIRTSCATIVSRRVCSKVSLHSIPFPNHRTPFRMSSRQAKASFVAARTVFQFSSDLLHSTSKWIPPMENSRAGMSPSLQSPGENRMDLQ
jgi:hypothetical protein